MPQDVGVALTAAPAQVRLVTDVLRDQDLVEVSTLDQIDHAVEPSGISIGASAGSELGEAFWRSPADRGGTPQEGYDLYDGQQ
ncbi:hypothetical protein [Microlunatus soli]|uniref:hypothetical protein n=1 Tax=Microlunatus soli TaxID=630515 RepID=UPI0015610067|nr:hypothetical protein [Microlunatus soli]